MIETPEIVTTVPQHYAAIGMVIPVSEVRAAIGAGCREIGDVLKAQGLRPTGPWFTHHRRRPGATFDFEICFPVATPVEASGRVMPGFWAATRVARTVFHGNYAELPHAWGELREWAQAEGLVGLEEFWEVYLVGPGDQPDAAEWRTQSNWPLG